MPIEAMLKRCRFPGGDEPLALGVSGGADSTAMALLAAAAGRQLVLWHIDHGLRPEASDYVEAVQLLAERLDAPLEIRAISLDAGGDLEARARRARYESLPADVCVAHTADDRAETILLNLFRGAGLAGVAAPFGRVYRPIICLRRSETVEVCRHFGVTPVADPMNLDESFTRVGVRRKLLPLLAEIFDRDPIPLLNRHADTVADALDVVAAASSEIDPTDTGSLGGAPAAVASDALRRWLREQTGDEHFVDMASIERVMAVVRGEVIAAEVVGGHRVARTAGKLRVEPARADPAGRARVEP